MISVSGREWQEKKFNINLVKKVRQDHNFSMILNAFITERIELKA